MANYKDVAVIHFQKNSEHGFVSNSTEDVLKQFELATQRLEKTGIDLVVTCEGMESSGQTMEQAESVDSPSLLMNAYSEFARNNHCCVVGSTKLKVDDKIFNAQVIFENDGSIAGDYRKVFLTDGELARGMTPGTAASVISTSAGRIGGAICFDLNFDELRQEYAALKPDIIAFSSMFHGGFIQQQWAFGCRCFFAAACKDESSCILDPLGRVLATANFYSLIGRARINLDRFFCHQDQNIQKISDIYRKYGTRVFIDHASDLGYMILYSLSNTVTAAEIAEEYDLIDIDDYFRDARKLSPLRN